MLQNKYGFFSDDGKEYIITNPVTPRPWINVISNGDYSMLVSQLGGGFSFRGNAEQNRITRCYQDIVKDNWGKYIYLRDLDSGDIWSAALSPIKAGADSYVVRHGLGYTVFERVSYGIKTELTVFVDPASPQEYMSLKVTNVSGENRRLDVTGYFEWALGIAYDTHREFQRLFYDLKFDKQLNAIVVNKCLWGFPDSKGRYNNDDWPYTAFFTCSEKVSSFDCDKETFIGMYRDEKDAAAFDVADLACSEGRYCDPVGALRTGITLSPEKSKTIVFSIGIARKGEEDYRGMIADCKTASTEKKLINVCEKWTRLLEREHVDSGDAAFDYMTNYWCKYQALSCRMWAKAGYYQISGGIGYRDQLQDSLIGLESDPGITRRQILLHASKQFTQGDVLHWWLSYNNAGPRTKCSDDFLWLPFVTINYLNETGDEQLLDEKVAYLDGAPDDIYGHCKAAIENSFSHFSPRGIPLMGDHDWNDGLSAVGNGMIGESFWVAEFLYWIITRFKSVAEKRGDAEFVKTLTERGAKLKEDFNKYAWDGEWFLQATNDLGEKIGSRENEEGKIFLNPQLWAVISDITDEDRKKRCMQSVKEYLVRDYGALLLSPEYRNPNTEIGYITRYAPGLRENGGVYTHAATWAVWAFALMGDNETAMKVYRGICPAARKDIDRLKTEPYALPGNSDGPISPYFGKGGWSWYTGSAQWLHRVAVQYILGVRPAENGLAIQPCVPEDWNGFTYIRRYRGAEYRIIAKRTGKKSLKLDGKEVDGGVVYSKTDCTVEVEF